jgi:cytidylate kinase
VLFGAAGKSTLAQQLASRINIPNVMQTDVIYEVRAGVVQCWRRCCQRCVAPCLPAAARRSPLMVMVVTR